MSTSISGAVAAVKAGASERLHDVAGNAAILAVVTLLALTLWVICIAGLIALLAPLWGVVAAIFIVALLVFITALVLLAMLQRRTRLQKLRTELRKAESRGRSQAALLAALPKLARNRSGAIIIGLGLVIGAMIVSGLNTDDET